MVRTKIFLFTASVIVLISASCTRQAMRTRASGYVIKAHATYQDTTQTLRGSANIRLQADSIVWVSFTKWGIEALRMRILPQQIEWLNRIERTHSRYVYDSLPMAFVTPELFLLWSAVLLGQVPNIEYDSLTKRQLVKRMGTATLHTNLVTANRVASHRLVWPPYTLEVDYGYVQKALRQLRVVANTPTHVYRLQLQYEEVRAVPDTTFPFQVPSSYNGRYKKTKGL